jgi:outer membrane murein-binding lipoprotein Lpp
MATSSNPKIQALMNETENLDPNDGDLESKLNLIAQKIAAAQREAKAAITGQPVDDSKLIDPSEAFACEGCQ